MNHHYQLLVVDIDGTLLDKNGAVSAEDKNALAKVKDLGIRVALSTGRAAQASRSIIRQLSLDGYHIFFDGALVSDTETGEEVYVRPISRELVRQMVEFAHFNEVNLDLFSATRYFVEKETWISDIRRHFFGLEPTIVAFTKLGQGERIMKGTLVVFSAEERAKAERFYPQFQGRLSFSRTKTPAYPEIDFINVLAPAVSKGKALEALASHLGVALGEVMAIGDAVNDVSLLSTAGLAIAMDNAPEELKAVADDITLDVEHHGLAVAIKKFLL